MQWNYDQFGIVATLQLADNVSGISCEGKMLIGGEFRCRIMLLLGKDFYRRVPLLVYQ